MFLFLFYFIFINIKLHFILVKLQAIQRKFEIHSNFVHKINQEKNKYYIASTNNNKKKGRTKNDKFDKIFTKYSKISYFINNRP